MDWYYAINNQRNGPVSEETLQNLISTGVVQKSTLVWCETMQNWAEAGTIPELAPLFQEAPPAQLKPLSPLPSLPSLPPQQSFPASNPFQPAQTSMEPAGILARFAGVFVDGLIIGVPFQVLQIIITVIAALMLGDSEDGTTGAIILQLVGGLVQLLSIVAALIYEVHFLTKSGSTPGRSLCGVKIVNVDGSLLTTGQAIGRYFAKILSSLICCIGFFMAFFNDEHITLHDQLCNTRVIKK